MTAFRALLVLILVVLVTYTAIVITGHGAGLFPIFFGDLARMAWPGQFNLDFMFMLTLSALWTAWRNGFSTTGFVLAALALVGGSLFLATYLLVLSWQTNGDMKRMVLGDARAASS